MTNLAMLGYYAAHRSESGKLLYWLGATILTIGVLKMKG